MVVGVGGGPSHPSFRPYWHGEHRTSTGNVHWRPGKATKAKVLGYTSEAWGWDVGEESFQPSGSEIAAPIPVSRVPGIPDGEGTQDSQLAARLDHLAHLLHLHDVAKVGEQGLVLGIH